jgi:flagellar basal-body rod modification protein FlgD
MTAPITGSTPGVNATTTNNDVSSARTATNKLNQDTFLKLLVAQLKYQDPMEPAKGAEFLAQTAQFTSVERLDELGKLTSELLASQMLVGATSMVGRTVTYTGADGKTASGVVTAAAFSGNAPVLRVNGTDVPLSSVTEVAAPKTAA